VNREKRKALAYQTGEQRGEDRVEHKFDFGGSPPQLWEVPGRKGKSSPASPTARYSKTEGKGGTQDEDTTYSILRVGLLKEEK